MKREDRALRVRPVRVGAWMEVEVARLYGVSGQHELVTLPCLVHFKDGSLILEASHYVQGACSNKDVISRTKLTTIRMPSTNGRQKIKTPNACWTMT